MIKINPSLLNKNKTSHPEIWAAKLIIIYSHSLTKGFNPKFAECYADQQKLKKGGGYNDRNLVIIRAKMEDINENGAKLKETNRRRFFSLETK